MIGFVAWTEEKAPRRAGESAILRMRFLEARLLRRKNTPAAVLRRRAAGAAKKFQKVGVTRAVFPEAFPYEAIFEKYGVFPVEVTRLYRSIAGEWLRAELANRGISGATRVAVCADHLTGELVRAVTELCLRYRYVLLDIPDGGEELARQLRREFGVSLLLRPAPAQMEAAEALLLFAPRPELHCAVTLPLYDGAPVPAHVILNVPVQEERMPHGCRRDQLFAALCSAGALRAEQIEVRVS
ncbi:hypothetical protein [Oscillibacter sp.]|uniref:hypothetical protein n=1 Tax=Oscillibacter sp. TaxID=1945593 RepID=UPI002896E605|nr:hypothetical protein [Oscillibacter sp.]